MGLILSEPMKKVVEIPKILAKNPVEHAKIHPKRPYRSRTSPGRKGRKKRKKTWEANCRTKNKNKRGNPVVFPYLPWWRLPPHGRHSVVGGLPCAPSQLDATHPRCIAWSLSPAVFSVFGWACSFSRPVVLGCLLIAFPMP